MIEGRRAATARSPANPLLLSCPSCSSWWRTAEAGGLKVVKLTGWAEGGHDNRYPDFQPSERLGGGQCLARNLKKLRDRGCRSVLYLHFIQMSPNSDFYRRHGEYCAIKGPYGNPFIDIFTWPSHGSIIGMNERFQLVNACPATEPWHRQVLANVDDGLKLGADCIFLDQTAGGPGSQLCFDRRHNHPGPAFACGPGKTALSQAAYERVRRHSPDTALGAEYIADVILQYYDFTIPFGCGFTFGGQHFGALYRYTFPEDILCTQYMARENYQQLHYSFVMGFRFFLAPGQQCELLTTMAPQFVQRLADLVSLRRQHADVLLAGRYLDTVPLEIGHPELVARAFESDDGAAATVWNPGPEPVALEVSWPGRTLRTVDTLTGPTATLAAGEVAVMRFACNPGRAPSP